MELPTSEIRSIASCRQDFPSLKRKGPDRELVYLDGPGGSQVPAPVIEAIGDYYRLCNSNTHGAFVTSQETDQIIAGVRLKMAALLGADTPAAISFGQNMTTLNFSLSKALARYLPGDAEILITQLDHEANRGPWLTLKEQGFTVKEVPVQPDGTLDYDDLRQKINSKTGLVAVGYASNAIGTVNDLKLISDLTKAAGALLLVDAVHYAPHFSIDVNHIDCDFLLCSAYKFYGPHVGVLYCREGLLNELTTDRLVTQDAAAPHRIETGTLNHAALAGVGAAVDYLAGFGQGGSLPEKIRNGMNQIAMYEFELYKNFYSALCQVSGLAIIGPAPDPVWHTPTISFTLETHTPQEVCQHLAIRGICAWDGHFYALRAIEGLGLLDRGGVTRLGISIYTSREELDYTVDCLRQLVE